MAAALTPLHAAELVLLREEFHKIRESLDTLDASSRSRDMAEYALLRKGVPALRHAVSRLELERAEAATIEWLHSAEPEPCPVGPVSLQCEEEHLQANPFAPHILRSSPSASTCAPAPRSSLGEKRGSETGPSGQGSGKARKVAHAQV